MTVVEDLRVARGIVARGWCKGDAKIGETYCAVGALNTACYGDALYVGLTSQRRDLALREVQKHLPTTYLHLADFNDADGTTQQDILDLFDKALASLGGLG